MTDLAALTRMLEAEKWTYAKTMPECPHEYIVRDKTLNVPDFSELADLLHRIGKPTKNKLNGTHYPFHYWPSSGYVYWTAGWPGDETIIINRALFQKHQSRDAIYDQIDGEEYDKLYSEPAYQQENEQLKKRLEPALKSEPLVLDVGCGTGLFLDLFPGYENYMGIDPSTSLLRQAAEKHGRQKFTCVRAEDWWREEQTNQMVISLFGSASYVDDKVWERFPTSKLFLMHYREGYTPATAPLIEDYSMKVPKETESGETMFDAYQITERMPEPSEIEKLAPFQFGELKDLINKQK